MTKQQARKETYQVELDNQVRDYADKVVEDHARKARMDAREFLRKANIRYEQQEKKHTKNYGKYYLPACVSSCQYGKKKKDGESGNPSEIRWKEPLKREIIQLGGMGMKTSKERRSILGGCAEQHVANSAIPNDLPDFGSIRFSIAVRPRTKQIIEPCDNCKQLFPSLKNI